MMEAELIKCLSERFYSDFADTVARRVRDAGAVGLLYEVVTSRYEGLPRAVRHKVAFRGAYVLEKIYFDAPDSFMPCAGKFCGTDFPACADPERLAAPQDQCARPRAGHRCSRRSRLRGTVRTRRRAAFFRIQRTSKLPPSRLYSSQKEG